MGGKYDLAEHIQQETLAKPMEIDEPTSPRTSRALSSPFCNIIVCT